MAVASVGDHYVGFYVDHEIASPNEDPGDDFYNELGGTTGAAEAGQSWEIDEPGFAGIGDIFDNFTAGTLDNSVGLNFLDDVAMAIAWDFGFAAGESAVIDFFLSTIDPGTTALELIHWDPDAAAEADPPDTIYFWSTLEIMAAITPPSSVPAPGTLGMLMAGLAALLLRRRAAIR